MSTPNIRPTVSAPAVYTLAPPTPERIEAMAVYPKPNVPPVERVAVLVCHGMGQQVPYETLDCVAKGLVASERKSGAAEVATGVAFARIGERRLPRAEVRVTGADGRKREVHVYEGYWAPLMEGRVSAWDVTQFLFAAGIAGISHSWSRKWNRWMFGGWETLRLKRGTLPLLSGAFLVVVSALTLYAVLGFVVVAKALHFLLIGNGKSVAASPFPIPAAPPGTGVASARTLWHAEPLVRALTADLLASPLFLPVLLGLVAGAIFRLLKPKLPPMLVRIVMWVLALWTVASATVMAVRWVRWVAGWPLVGLGGTDYVDRLAPHGDNLVYPLFVTCAVATVMLIRSFYIQYFGDVAAYVSSHKVNKFNEVREQVKAVGREAARAVYEAADPATGKPVYQRVLVVGHSLGSVVAYDTLNGMLNEDLETGGRLRVEARTEALVTFGSPLDKTAFIFRTQLRDAVYREALAAANQPMIQPPGGARRIPWINIWSPQDPVSGPIDFYDPRTGTRPGHLPVDNQVDAEADIPAIAHTQYWENRCLARYLHDLVTGRYIHPAVERTAESMATV